MMNEKMQGNVFQTTMKYTGYCYGFATQTPRIVRAKCKFMPRHTGIAETSFVFQKA